MRGLLFIPVLIGVLGLGYWFMNQESLQEDVLGQIKHLKGSFFSQAKPPRHESSPRETPAGQDQPPVREAPPPAAAKAPAVNFTGLYREEKTAALLRLRQVRGSLEGQYAPPGNYASLYRFKGKADGHTARFDLKISGLLWHCTLEVEDDDSLTLRGRRDMDAMMQAYGQDGRLPNGNLIMSPRSAEQKRADALRLQKRREEITKSVETVLLGTFERIETQ
jgi:hypothetical protein